MKGSCDFPTGQLVLPVAEFSARTASQVRVASADVTRSGAAAAPAMSWRTPRTTLLREQQTRHWKTCKLEILEVPHAAACDKQRHDTMSHCKWLCVEHIQNDSLTEAKCGM